MQALRRWGRAFWAGDPDTRFWTAIAVVAFTQVAALVLL